MTTLLLFGSFFLLILLNVPVAAAMGLATIVGIKSEGFTVSTNFANLMYSSMAKSVLLAIPFFILAGVLMDYAGISRRLIRFARVMVGHLHGGLAIVVVVVSCFFAAISGSGPATVAALGGILIPAMAEAGYDKNMSASLVAASGGIGIIIPPSIAFVIFAMLAEISVGNLFMCGIVPGLVMGLFYCLAAFWSMRGDTNIARQRKAAPAEVWAAFKDAIWGLLTPVIILGGIYGGVFTPTEASGVAVVYGLFVGVVIYREINVRDIWTMLVDSALTSAVVMFLLACAGVFGWLLTITDIAENLSISLMNISTNPIIILLLINILFLIAGCFVEANAAYCIFLPILLPILHEINYNIYAFGVFMVSSFAVGMITPPVGANLYVACNVGKVSMKDICSRVFPFVSAGALAVLLFTYVPQIALFLPRLMGLKV